MLYQSADLNVPTLGAKHPIVIKFVFGYLAALNVDTKPKANGQIPKAVLLHLNHISRRAAAFDLSQAHQHPLGEFI